MSSDENKMPSDIIRNHRMVFARQLRQAEEALASERRRIRMAEYDLQKQCPHENVVFYPDAAGGFDSIYECRDCGRESKQKFGVVKEIF